MFVSKQTVLEKQEWKLKKNFWNKLIFIKWNVPLITEGEENFYRKINYKDINLSRRIYLKLLLILI